VGYIGNEPADVAVQVGSDVITSTEIQDASIATADIANDAITANKVDDDGTGFQMGSLGLGTTVSGSEKLTVGGTASFNGLTVSGSSVPQLLIGGTTPTIYLGDSGAEDTKLVFRGNATDVYLALDDSADKLLIGQGTTVGGDTRITIDPANGNTTFAGEIRANSFLRLYTTDDQANNWYLYTHTDDTFRMNYNGSGGDELTMDTSGNTTFEGDVTVDGDRYMLTESGTNKGFFGKDDWATSGGSANDVNIGCYSGVVKITSGAGSSSTPNIICNTNKTSTFGGAVGVGTTTINSNATLHVRGGDSGQSSSSNNTQLTVESNGTAGIQILTGTTNVGGFWVGDSNGSETGGKLYYSNSDDSWQFYNQGSNNGLTITANGLVQCKRGFTNGQALDIEGETFGRTNSSNVAFGYRQDGSGVLFKLQKSSTDVFQIVNSGRIHQEISENSAYAASFENTASGGHGLRVYGGASSADYLIRGHDHNGNDKFAVRSNGLVQLSDRIDFSGKPNIGNRVHSAAISSGSSSQYNMNGAGGNCSGGFIVGACHRDTSTTADNSVIILAHLHTQGANVYSTIIERNDDSDVTISHNGSGMLTCTNNGNSTVNFVVKYILLTAFDGSNNLK
tara:strand:- start:234 stop:2096 length:1863 start_codon:yes stop_codon:yes gene_type:complete